MVSREFSQFHAPCQNVNSHQCVNPGTSTMTSPDFNGHSPFISHFQTGIALTVTLSTDRSHASFQVRQVRVRQERSRAAAVMPASSRLRLLGAAVSYALDQFPGGDAVADDEIALLRRAEAKSQGALGVAFSLYEFLSDKQHDWECRPDAAGIEIPPERNRERRRRVSYQPGAAPQGRYDKRQGP